MWAEAQLDRSRLKEEFISKLDFPSLTGGRVETQVASSAVEGSQSSLVLFQGFGHFLFEKNIYHIGDRKWQSNLSEELIKSSSIIRVFSMYFHSKE